MRKFAGLLVGLFLTTNLCAATITIDIDDSTVQELIKRDSFIKAQKGATVTLINYVIDRTGSMGGKEEFIVEEFNKYLDSLKTNKNSKCDKFVTMMMFSESYDRENFDYLLIDEPISEVRLIGHEDYITGGNTPLYDAIARMIHRTEPKIKELEKQGEIVRVLTIIMTDGEENASLEYNEQTLGQLIKRKEKEKKWTFVYIGANQDSYEVARGFNIPQGNIKNWVNTSAGITDIVNAISCDTATYTVSGDVMVTDTFFSN